MPTANSTTVPQGKPFCDCFQSITPMRGNSISATAAMVVEVVSKLCSTFSVDQKPSSTSTTASSFHWFSVMGPSSASCWRMVSWPPAISFISGSIMRVMMKNSATVISAANGAAATNHSPQVIWAPSCFSMKPMATMFCAAAVLMPTFQMLAVCAVVMTSRAAKRLLRSTLKASTKPIMIGMRQATRAVVLGTMNDSRKPTTMAPITMWCVLAPTFDSTVSAMRRSSPVAVMADAMKHAAATSATALLAKPESARFSAAPVPMSGPSGLATLGA